MHLFEYQGKSLFQKYGLLTPEGFVAFNKDDIMSTIERLLLSNKSLALKAQIKSGGRKKAGGVKIINDIASAEKFVDLMLGKKLITKQSPQGEIVVGIYIEEVVDIVQEIYLSFNIDDVSNNILIIASASGGIDIEDNKNFIKEVINPFLGLRNCNIRNIFYSLNLSSSLYKDFSETLMKLYQCFIKEDLTLLEINPLALTKIDQSVVINCLDAKIIIDNNAEGKHYDIFSAEYIEDKNEKEAKLAGLNYIKLDGDIGCMVNGAGLAMATMDFILYKNYKPANFLDIGGNSDAIKIEKAMNILLSDLDTKGIFVNIFGGIVRCDDVAEGIINALHKNNPKPLLVRLDGTNKDNALKKLQDSGFKIVLIDDFSNFDFNIEAA